ncbi:TNFL4 factor, partial [Urocolius indicus]|nr:TNFL4 factor [Urocolius indicus]
MEGQPDTEMRNRDQMDHEKEHAEDEWNSWRRGQVRNTLYLVSAAAQWILLLTCLVYLGIDSLQPSTKPFVITGSSLLSSTAGESIGGVAVNLIAEMGFIQIQNGSIIIPCDGLYLVSLKGIIHQPVPAMLKLTLWKISESLWE